MSGLKLAPALIEMDPRRNGPCRGPDDPLLNAVIWKLPDIGQAFPAPARQAWLNMLAMAMDVAYGAEIIDMPIATSSSAPAAPVAAAPAPAKLEPHVVAGCDYYVDAQGFARSDIRLDDQRRQFPTPQRRVLAEEIEGDNPIYDYRGVGRDRSTVVWADDVVGSRPGMAFCGPG